MQMLETEVRWVALVCGEVGLTGDAGERNCIRGPQSVTGMSSTGARAREDSSILPTIRHPANPHARAGALMTEAVGLELVWSASLARGARQRFIRSATWIPETRLAWLMSGFEGL